METPNPYQAPNSPVEPFGDPEVLPLSAYISASFSAIFVFVGATAALGLTFGWLVEAPGLGGLIILTSAPLIGIALGAVSFGETLQLERRKRHKRHQAAHAPPSDEGLS